MATTRLRIRPGALIAAVVAVWGGGVRALAQNADTGLGLALGETRLTFQPPEPKPAAGAQAPTGSDDSEALAKKLSNPVASLISVPFQFNYDEGFGPKD